MHGVAKLSNDPGDMGLIEVPRPAARPGHVLIEVAAAGICGTDLHILKGEYRVVPPVIVGHEVCGIVCEVGDGVAAELVGQRVVSETFFSVCGACRMCRAGRPNLCAQRKSIGTHVNGAMAPFVEVPAYGLHAVPEHLSDAAASMTEPVACVANSLFGGGEPLGAGLRVLVVGPGAIGLIAAQVARACGAEVALAGTARDRARLDVAESMGLAVLDPSAAPAVEAYDCAIECAGAEGGVTAAISALARGGRLIQMGIVGRPATLPYDLICLRELRVTAGFASTPRSWLRAMRLLETRAVDLEPIVSDVVPVADWRGAFDRALAGGGIKQVLNPRLP